MQSEEKQYQDKTVMSQHTFGGKELEDQTQKVIKLRDDQEAFGEQQVFFGCNKIETLNELGTKSMRDHLLNYFDKRSLLKVFL